MKTTPFKNLLEGQFVLLVCGRMSNYSEIAKLTNKRKGEFLILSEGNSLGNFEEIPKTFRLSHPYPIETKKNGKIWRTKGPMHKIAITDFYVLDPNILRRMRKQQDKEMSKTIKKIRQQRTNFKETMKSVGLL